MAKATLYDLEVRAGKTLTDEGAELAQSLLDVAEEKLAAFNPTILNGNAVPHWCVVMAETNAVLRALNDPQARTMYFTEADLRLVSNHPIVPADWYERGMPVPWVQPHSPEHWRGGHVQT